MTGLSIALAFALLLANGFFVAVEFALIASRRTKLEALADEGSTRAKVALKATQHLNLQLAGAQLGITMASLLLGYVAEPAVAGLLESGIEQVVDLHLGQHAAFPHRDEHFGSQDMSHDEVGVDREGFFDDGDCIAAIDIECGKRALEGFMARGGAG